uniref:Uncharacterized protein n=1 Tax=Rhizophora mucronata TaxID=61149 RepID=A0A2P2IUT0_RHIMU
MGYINVKPCLHCLPFFGTNLACIINNALQ